MQPDIPQASELPAPQSVESPGPVHEQMASAVEHRAVAAELPQVGAQMPAPVTQSGGVSTALPTDPLTSTSSPHAGSQNNGLQADDADLIEKEWVVRAKSIVASTQDNPHEQTKEMSKFKADYIKKRYNKDLKVSEG